MGLQPVTLIRLRCAIGAFTFVMSLGSTMTARAAEAMPGMSFGHAVDAEHDWDFLLIEIDAAHRADFGNVEYAVWTADGVKIALTRVALVASLTSPGTLVGRVLVSDRWPGRYELTIMHRGIDGTHRARVHDARALLDRVRTGVRTGH
jgi:hypothetical protein